MLTWFYLKPQAAVDLKIKRKVAETFLSGQPTDPHHSAVFLSENILFEASTIVLPFL